MSSIAGCFLGWTHSLHDRSFRQWLQWSWIFMDPFMEAIACHHLGSSLYVNVMRTMLGCIFLWHDNSLSTCAIPAKLHLCLNPVWCIRQQWLEPAPIQVINSRWHSQPRLRCMLEWCTELTRIWECINVICWHAHLRGNFMQRITVLTYFVRTRAGCMTAVLMRGF